LLNPKPMSASWLVLTPLLITGVASLRCFRFCTCDVKDALMSILKPEYSTPGVFVVSNTLMPRRSTAR
jgi:hypothetical protein